MRTEQLNFFQGKRMQMDESIQETVNSLLTYGHLYDHWCIAWSGGKDSSTLLTLVIYLIDSGKVPAPKSLTVFYADTRQELLPLQIAAAAIMDELRDRGYNVQVVMAPLEKRFLPYMLGRGVPPPNNSTFRWCTRQIKIDPMKEAVMKLRAEHGQKVLMLTGVRVGESAVRDNRIATSCSKDGAECGQGWYQTTMPEDYCDTLAPILHWRVCHVWEWLRTWAPTEAFGDWSTKIIAEAYGGDEAEEKNARTGCNGCPLATKDTALDGVLRFPQWAYIAPLKRLRPIYRWMRWGGNRLRKTGKDSKEKNVQRMGPLTIEARKEAFARIIAVQNEINEAAERLGRPHIDILNEEEIAHIKQCWESNVWPNRWDGDEPTGDELMDLVHRDGTIQPTIFGN